MPIGKIEPIPVGPGSPFGPFNPRKDRGIKLLAESAYNEFTLDVIFTTNEKLHDDDSEVIPKSRLRAFIRRLDGADDFTGLEYTTSPRKGVPTPAAILSGSATTPPFTYRFEYKITLESGEVPTWEDRPIRVSIYVRRRDDHIPPCGPEWLGGTFLDTLSGTTLLLTDEERKDFFS